MFASKGQIVRHGREPSLSREGRIVRPEGTNRLPPGDVVRPEGPSFAPVGAVGISRVDCHRFP